MAHSDNWNAAFEALPTNDNYGYEIDNYIRTVWQAVRERMEIDHYWKDASSQANDGKHKKITLPVLAAAPTEIASGGIIYTKDVSAKAELFYVDEDGTEVQLTSGGVLSITSIINAALKIGRDTDNYIDWGTDDQLDIKIGGVLSEIASITQGAADNDKLVSQGYVDDAMTGAVQVVNVQSGALATSATVIPYDDTIPQITEGDEWTTLAITPVYATSYLIIDVILQVGRTNYTNVNQIAALFVDTTAGALCAAQTSQDNYGMAVGGINTITMRYRVLAGSTTARTYKVRFGPGAAGTMNINGAGGARKFGGVCLSSITITELYV